MNDRKLLRSPSGSSLVSWMQNFSYVYVDKNLPTLSIKDVVVLTPNDVPELKNLISPQSVQMFGNVDVYQIMYGSNLSVGVTGPDGKLVGAIFLKNYPNVSAVPPWSWLQWMTNLFGCESVTQRNCLWIYLMLWKPTYCPLFLKPMLQYIFKRVQYKDYVMLAIPPGNPSITCLGESASRVLPKGHLNPAAVTTLGMMARQDYVTNYKIRKAVEEDNDDLVPLIEKFSSRLREMYGDYYIAELLTRFPDSKRHIIVAEYEGYAVAVVIMNETVNYDMLNDQFELVCFHGLRTAHEDDFMGSQIADDIEVRDSEDQQLSALPSLKGDSNPLKTDSLEEKEEDEKEIDDNWRLTDSILILFPDLTVLKEDIKQYPGLASFVLPTKQIKIEEDHDAEDIISETSFALNYDEYDSRLYREALSATRKSLVGSIMSSGSYIFEPETTQTADTKSGAKFYGQKNAFLLEVVAAKEDHEDALELLIEAAFESFVDRNYCCICVPTEHHPMKCLQRFVRIPPRAEKNHPQELYVLHKNAVQPEIVVRLAIHQDLPCITQFIKQMYYPGNILHKIKFALRTDPWVENHSNLCFIMIVYKQIVGLALLNEDVELEYIMSHYGMYKWIDERQQQRGTYAVIENILIYPVFQNNSPFFLTQMHTLADYSVLFYLITPEDMSNERKRVICNTIQQFVPITPRMVQNYSSTGLKGEFMPTKNITRLDTPYSLYLSMSRLSSITRIEINSRIVVVGSGDTASSFLETLITTCSEELLVTFTNVVVVSPHGLAQTKEPNKARDMFFIRRGHFKHRPMPLTALRAHLSFAPSVVNEIKRQDKQVHMSDGTFLPYDILLLLAGEQYQAPTEGRGGYSSIPTNIFIVNTDADASNALKRVTHYKDSNVQGKVIVYGHDLRSHCALAALLEYEVPPELLVFVNPISRTYNVDSMITYDNLIYDDPNVELGMARILEKEGITVYQGHFSDWELDTESDRVKTVKFECPHRLLTLQCNCMFMFTQKYISRKTFNAIVNSGLVFDGRVVIDANFRTNDPNIYAAGSVTKYSRRYHADHLAHLYYNAEEVGEKLGLHIRDFLIPDEYKSKRPEPPDPFPIKIVKEEESLPTFEKPIIKCCTVVGKLNYCHITKPGKQVPAELSVTQTNTGKMFVTGDVNNLTTQGYFKIHINEFKLVETITCLTKDEIYVNSLLQVWGKHVKLLNDLEWRFELMMIPDLFEFFKEPWTCAIYYDRFKEVKQKIRQMVLKTKVSKGKTIAETTYDFLIQNEWNHLNMDQKVEILRLFDESDLRNQIEDQIIEYIEENTIELPMYAHITLIKNILHDYEKSPMFSE